MDDVQPASQRSWRPRFSLLTAIFLMTIVGMAIVIAQLWHELARCEMKCNDCVIKSAS